MSFQNLNIDVIYEIFTHFVATEDDGPFKLLVVCTAWQDFVISNPLLWTWITIDEQVGDMEAKIYAASTLSAGHPLHVTVHMPCCKLSILQNLMDRCRWLIVHAHSKRFPRYPDYDIQNAAAEIRRLLPLSPTIALDSIKWYHDGLETKLNPWKWYRPMNNDQDLNQMAFFQSIPSVMISDFQISISLPPQADNSPLHLKDWSLPSMFPYLTNLQIFISFTTIDWVNWPEIILPRLLNLEVHAESQRDVTSWAAISSISAPLIHSVKLNGNESIFNAVHLLCDAIHPSHIDLEMASPGNNGILSNERLKEVLTPQMIYITSFRIDVSFVMGRLGQKEIADLMWNINILLTGPALTSAHLAFKGLKYHHIRMLKYTRFPVDVSITQDATTYTIFEASQTVLDERLHSFQINHLTLSLGNSEPDINLIRISKLAKQLTIKPVCLPMVMQRRSVGYIPEGSSFVYNWPRQFEKLDTGNSTLHRHFNVVKGGTSTSLDVNRDAYSSSVSGTHRGSIQSFGLLQVLRCTTILASCLLKWDLLPTLRELTLIYVPNSQCIYTFDGLSQWLVDTAQVGAKRLPQLTILALEFYPQWQSLLQFVGYITQYRSRSPGLSLKLPGLPHASILALLVTALGPEGNTPQFAIEAEPRRSYGSDKRLAFRGCDYCRGSGWRCEYASNLAFCHRHSPDNLVTITKYTL